MANGLLDFLQTPEGQGLLAATFGGLAGARRGEPINSLGRAGLAGLSGYAGAQDRQMMQENAGINRELRDMQIQQMRAAQEREAMRQKALPTLYETPTTQPQVSINAIGLPQVDQAAVTTGAPRLNVQRALASGFSPQEVAAMAQIDQIGQPKPISPTASMQEYTFAKQQGYKGSFVEFKRDMQQQAAQQPYFQFLPSEQGYLRGNARTGEVQPVQVGGQSVMPAAQSPRVQGEIVTAKETAEAGVKNKETARSAVNKSDVMLEQIAQAEKLLKQGPTGSGVGSVVDAAGRVVGMSSPSAQTAAQLKAVSGWLVANVPRMEGPQSNFDVQNYQTMAGMVGNENIPVSERMAALAEVRRLQEKYRQYNQEKVEPAQAKTEMQEMPKASMSNRGRILLDQSTGKRYRSNGMSWEPL